MSRPLTDSLDANVARLKEMFGNSADLYAKPVNVRGVPCCLCFLRGFPPGTAVGGDALDAEREPF